MITVNTTPTIESKPISRSKPTMALVMHDLNNYLSVTRHDIQDGKIGRGSIIETSDVIDLLHSELLPKTPYGKQQAVTALLPDNVLIDNAKYLVWQRKSQVDQVWFSGTEKKPTFSYKVKMPSLIFVVNKQSASLSLCAVATNARPTLEKKVYLAPIQNYSSNGSFCLGSARLPDERSVQTLKEMEDCVFSSQFTHFNHPTILKALAKNSRTRKDTEEQYFDILADKESSQKGFYAKELMPISNHTTLGDWLNSIMVK